MITLIIDDNIQACKICEILQQNNITYTYSQTQKTRISIKSDQKHTLTYNSTRIEINDYYESHKFVSEIIQNFQVKKTT